MYAKISLLLLVLLAVAIGCDTQSPNARLVDNFELTMGASGDMPPWTLDYWDLYDEEVGELICGALFAYRGKIVTEDVEVAGIQLTCEVTGHEDPFGAEGDYWDRRAPNGEEYGYIAVPGGEWDEDDEIARGRTNPSGEVWFLPGLGDPTTGVQDRPPYWCNQGYEWPSGGDQMISTVVELKFSMPKINGGPSHECHISFVRPQWATFWESTGVLANSKQTLVPYEGPFSVEVGNVTLQLEPVRLPSEMFEQTLASEKGKRKDDTSIQWTKRSASISSGDNWEVLEGVWAQYKYWGGGWGWYFHADPNDLKIIPLWITDPNDPNDIIGLVSASQPYGYWATIWVLDPDNVVAENHTAILVSRNSLGEKVAWMPLPMHVTYNWGHGEGMEVVSAFIVPLETTHGNGIHFDRWGNRYATIYLPENGYMEVRPDDFYGDFNFDYIVNFEDYCLLMMQYGRDIWNDEWCNLIYDGTHDGKIDDNDLALFCQNWLASR